jgi:hypothetical protein
LFAFSNLVHSRSCQCSGGGWFSTPWRLRKPVAMAMTIRFDVYDR